MGKIVDITGQRFGRLTVIEQAGRSNGRQVLWKCKCDCGNEIITQGGHLRSGHTQSCGCYNKQRTQETQRKDITNQRFGKLIALEPTTDFNNRNRHTMWLCKCDCGNITKVSINNLLSKATQSCGCLKTSIGELNIETLLRENNIEYIKEKTFKDLGKLRFDFYLPTYQRLIEFDGIQHYKELNGIWDKKQSLQERKNRDKIKNQYALNNNIPLVRIPYWKRDNITLEMLLGNQYLIKEE